MTDDEILNNWAAENRDNITHRACLDLIRIVREDERKNGAIARAASNLVDHLTINDEAPEELKLAVAYIRTHVLFLDLADAIH